MAVVSHELHSGIAVLWIDNPPVNALGQALRQGIVSKLETLEADDAVQAIVLRARGRTFPAGADITEFGKPPMAPSLPDVCNRIEACPKLVVAALHGTVLGGGFEVAMSAHYRIAAEGAQVGLPEVNLGILPGAGGTQRLPRLAGLRPALEFITTGRPLPVGKAQRLEMIDKVVDGDLTEQALAYARALLDAGKPPRRTSTLRGKLRLSPEDVKVLHSYRQTALGNPVPAYGKIVECVEAAQLLPFEAGLAFERAAFEDCLKSPESAALRHAFLSERRAAKFPELDGKPVTPLRKIGIVGGGLMGAGIAVACLNAGLEARIVEADQARAEAARARVEATFQASVAKKRMPASALLERMARLSVAWDLGDLKDRDIVIEAIVEDLDAKVTLLKSLADVLPAPVLIATNTSYLDVDLLAEEAGRPDRFIGMHFFSPADRMRLLEVVVGAQTSALTVQRVHGLGRTIGKIPVRSGVTDGFIGNRVLTAYRTAADFAVEDGASPYEIDAAMRGFGFVLGPYQTLDMAGLDISWARRKRLAATRDPSQRYVAIGDRLCEAGRFGKKTRKGYYDYSDEHPRGAPSEAVMMLIGRERAAQQVEQRDFEAEELRERMLLAMISEGMKLLAEGIAARPSDIDTVMLHGFGFPRWRGGPMHTADHMGLLSVKSRLEALAREEGSLWEVSPLLIDLIKNGKDFSSLN